MLTQRQRKLFFAMVLFYVNLVGYISMLTFWRLTYVLSSILVTYYIVKYNFQMLLNTACSLPGAIKYIFLLHDEIGWLPALVKDFQVDL